MSLDIFVCIRVVKDIGVIFFNDLSRNIFTEENVMNNNYFPICKNVNSSYNIHTIWVLSGKEMKTTCFKIHKKNTCYHVFFS